jgi:hypothetical protein
MGRPKAKQQPSELEPLDYVTSFIPIPWNEVIQELLVRPIRLTQPVTEGQLALIWVEIRAWEAALHWVIKWEWRTKHKIPLKRSLAKRYEAKGRFLQQIFRLCERCHTFQDAVPSVKIPYRHAAYWFGVIYWEFLWNEVVEAFPAKELKKGMLKDNLIAERRAKFQGYKDRKNPISQHSPREATYKLFEVARELAEQSESFEENYWNKFVAAYKDETAQLDSSNYARIFVEEDGRAYVQSGKGRGRLYMPPPSCWKEKLEKLNFITLIE